MDIRTIVGEERHLPGPTPRRAKEACHRRPWVRLLAAGLVAAGLAAALCRPAGRAGAAPRPEESVVLAASGRGAEEEEGVCSKYPYLKIQRLIHDNLAGLGPNVSQVEGMAYDMVDLGQGSGSSYNREVVMTMNATSKEYHPFSPRMNGVNGKYATLNMKPGSEIQVEVRWKDKLTMKPLTLRRLAWSFFDLDQGHNGQGQESVTVHPGFRSWHITHRSEVQVAKHGDGSVTFASSTYGNGEDNPSDPQFLTDQQRNRAVTLLYKDIDHLRFTVRAASGVLPRFYTFCARPSLMCAVEVEEDFRPPLPALNFDPEEEVPVLHTRGVDFVKWLVEPGQEVKQYDAMGKVKLEDGTKFVVRAPIAGTVTQLAGLKSGEDPRHRLSDAVVAVVRRPPTKPIAKSTQESRPPLPKLLVGDGEIPVAVTINHAMFKRWVVNVGQTVEKGDAVALTVLEDGTSHVVPAPAAGLLVRAQPLQPGEYLDIRLTDPTVAVLKPLQDQVAKLPTLSTRSDTDALVRCKGEGETFQRWTVQVGDRVEKGDAMAVTTSRSGDELVYEAPKAGLVSQLQPLQSGDDMDEVLSECVLAVVETVQETVAPYPDLVWTPPLEVPLRADKGREKFKGWLKEVPATVLQGDPIAETTLTDNKTKTYKAPADGFLVRLQALKRGDDLDVRLHDHAIAVVRLPQDTYAPLPNLEFTPPLEVPVRAARGAETFHRWVVQDGDFVQQDDPVAESLLMDGTLHVHRAPRPGLVLRTQALREGARLDQQMQDTTIAVLKLPMSALKSDTGAMAHSAGGGDGGSAPRLPNLKADLPSEVPLLALRPHEKFHRWIVNVGQLVQRGDPMAETLLEDGALFVNVAPAAGLVMRVQPLVSGEVIDERTSDKVIAVVKVLQDGDAKLPALSHEGSEEVALERSGGEEFFGAWLVNVGDLVRGGDPMAETWTKDGTVKIYHAPASGVCVRLQPLQQGEYMESRLSENVIAVVRKTEPLAELPLDDKAEVALQVKLSELRRDPKSPEFFHSWRAAVGDSLKQDAPVMMTFRKDGSTNVYTAPKTGVLVRVQPLRPGEDLLHRLPDATFAAMSEELDKSPLPDLHVDAGAEVPVKVKKDKEKFERWLVNVGDAVLKDDSIAETLLGDGSRHTYKSPKSGFVVKMQPLSRGDDLETSLGDPTIAAVRVPQDFLPELDADPPSEVRVKAAAGSQKFHRWTVQVGDTVQKDEPIAETLLGGALKVYKSPQAGRVTRIQPLRPGDDVEAMLSGGTMAVVKAPSASSSRSSGGQASQPLPALDREAAHEVAVKADGGGERFLRWTAKVGGVVRHGDPVAETLRTDGIMHTYKAPADGIVMRVQPLQPGDDVDSKVADGVLAVLLASKGKAPKLPPLPINSDVAVPVQVGGGHEKFHGYRVAAGSKVKKSDVVAETLAEDGALRTYTAPENGLILRLQPLQEGEYLDERLPDTTLAVLATQVPHMVTASEEGRLQPFKSLEFDPQWEVPLRTEPGEEKFLRWTVSIGDSVEQGGVMAEALKEDGTIHEYTAPASGLVVRMQPMRPGEHVGRRLPDKTIAVVRVLQDTLPRLPKLQYKAPLEVPLEGAHGGEKFGRWLAKVGDAVLEGDPVAESTKKDGTLHVFRAPGDGVVKQLQPLQVGEDMDQRLPDNTVGVMSAEERKEAASADEGPLAALEVPDAEAAVEAPKEDARFHRYVANVGETVKKDEPLAELLMEDGSLEVLKAPEAGLVMNMQPLQQGEDVGKKLSDKVVVVVKPPQEQTASKTEALPRLSHGAEREVPLRAGAGAQTFHRWLVKVGESVVQDQPMADVLLDGKLHQYKAPVTGLVVRLQALQPGSDVEDSLAGSDDIIGVVKMRKLARASASSLDLGPKHFPALTAHPPLEEPFKVGGKGEVFKRWTTGLGEAVQEGDSVFETLQADGKLHVYKAPVAGIVQAVQPLQEGDEVDSRIVDGVVAVVKKPSQELPRLSPLGVGHLEVPVNVHLGKDQKFHRWVAGVGSSVVEGDAVAELTHGDGELVTYRAPATGVVVRLAPLQQGEDVDARLSNATFAVVREPPADGQAPPKYPALEYDPETEVPLLAQKTEGEESWRRWLVKVGEPVQSGAPLAESLVGAGTGHTYVAPRGGLVVKLLPLQLDDDLHERLSSGVIAVIRLPADETRKLPKLAFAPPSEVPIAAKSDGETFHALRASVGSAVKQGDVVVETLLKDGSLQAYTAPEAGVVLKAQPLRPGEEIDLRLEDKTLAVVKVPEPSSEAAPGKTSKLPKLEYTPPLQVPTESAPGNETFHSWSVNVGDTVLKGDPIAETVLEDGTLHVIKAPAGGLVLKLQSLKPGDDLKALLPDPAIAVVKVPMISDGDEVSVVAKDGEQVLSFAKQVGEPVQAGDVVAVVKGPDSQVAHYVAPKSGVLAKANPELGPGKTVDSSVSDKTLGVIRPLTIQVKADGNEHQVWKSFAMEGGETVSVGETIGETYIDGQPTCQWKAPVAGTVVHLSRTLSPGVAVPEPTVVAEIEPKDGEVPVLLESEALPETFIAWHARPGDVVELGEKLAVTKKTSGELHEYKSPIRGVVAMLHAGLLPLQTLDKTLPDKRLAMVRPLVTEVPVKALDGEAVKSVADVKPGDKVSRGSVLGSMVELGGASRDLLAPADGVVVTMHPDLKPGAKLPGETVCTVKPEGATVPILIRSGDTFVSWHKAKGDFVRMDDVFAASNSTDGRTHEHRSPVNGVIVERSSELSPGQVIGGKLSGMTIAMIEPLATVVPMKAMAGETFQQFDALALHEEPVRAGHVMAILHRQNGEEHGMRAPIDGVVFKQRADLASGAEIAPDMEDKTIFAVHAVMGEVPHLLLGNETFAEFKVETAQAVQFGDVLAVTTLPDGKTREYKARVNGIATKLHPGLKPGRVIDDSVIDKNIAVVMPQINIVPVFADVGETFKEAKVAEGTKVSRGDVIAITELPGGEKHTYKAPVDGVVKKVHQDMQPGVKIDEQLYDKAIVKIQPEGGQVPVAALSKEVFDSWGVKEGEKVQPGDTLAVTTRPDGSKHTYRVPLNGRVLVRHPGLVPGTILNYTVSDKTLAVIEPLDGPLHFQAYDRAIGDVVLKGDPLIEATDIFGDDRTIVAPKSGVITALVPLRPGEPFQPDEPSRPVTLSYVPGLTGDVFATVEPHMIFRGFKKKLWDEVTKGEAIATASKDEDSPEVEIKAQLTGVIKSFVQGLSPGVDLNKICPDGIVAVVGKLDPLVARNKDVTVNASDSLEGLKFKEWLADAGSIVTEGQAIAHLLGTDGKEKEVTAPMAGELIQRREQMRPNYTLANVMDDAGLAVVRPVAEGAPVPVVAPPQATFEGWKAKEGDSVGAGGGIATVLLPTRTPGRTGSEVSVAAPAGGDIIKEKQLRPGQPVGQLPIARVSDSSGSGLPIWLTALLSALALLCLLFLCFAFCTATSTTYTYEKLEVIKRVTTTTTVTTTSVARTPIT